MRAERNVGGVRAEDLHLAFYISLNPQNCLQNCSLWVQAYNISKDKNSCVVDTLN